MDLVFCLWALNFGHPLRPSSGLIDGSRIGYLLRSLGSYMCRQSWLLLIEIPRLKIR